MSPLSIPARCFALVSVLILVTEAIPKTTDTTTAATTTATTHMNPTTPHSEMNLLGETTTPNAEDILLNEIMNNGGEKCNLGPDCMMQLKACVPSKMNGMKGYKPVSSLMEKLKEKVK